MHNSTYKLLKDLKKSASAMQGGSFLPPAPLPNSVKAKQIEQQEMAEDAAASTGDPMAQMQKAQQDAVNQVSQLQQQLQQTQGELQAMQMQMQQQQQQTQMQAQQEIAKAQMDAEYKLQEEKIKNQKQLLSMQEKYMKTQAKNAPAPAANQSPILANQLKRVVKKVNNIKIAKAPPVIDATTGQVIGNTADTALATVPNNTPGTLSTAVRNPGNATRTISGTTRTVGGATKALGGAAAKTLGRAVPLAGAAISGASAIDNFRRGNYLSAGLDALGGAASFIPGFGIPLAVGAGLASSYFQKPETPAVASPEQPTSSPQYPEGSGGGFQNPFAQQSSFMGNMFGGMQPPQRWDSGLSPSERFNVMNTAAQQFMPQNKMAAVAPSVAPAAPIKKVTPDIREFMKNPPPPGEHIASPIPFLQEAWRPNNFGYDISNPSGQQGYGRLGNFIRNIIFQVGMPALGLPGFAQPDFSRLYGGLSTTEPYKVNPDLIFGPR